MYNNEQKVLQQGDLLYTGVKQQLQIEGRFQSDHLAVEEMPQQTMTDTNVYNVHMSPVVWIGEGK